MSRTTWRLLFVVVVALLAAQLATAPLGFEGYRPRLQAPRLRVNLGLDLQGGSHLVLEAQDTATVKATPEAVEAAMRVIESRIDQLGVVEPTIQRVGDRRIIVELPGIEDPERALRLIGKTALLEFTNTGRTQLPEGSRWNPQGTAVTIPGPQTRTINLKKDVILTGADLAEAQAGFQQGSGVTTGTPIVSFRFKGPAGKKFEEFTASHVGQYLTIVLDNEVISSPVIQEKIGGGSGQISGGFRDIAEARELAVLLRAGSLPIPVEVVERRTVGPSLGRDSLDLSLRAGAIAVALIVAFMIALYRLPGVLADAALLLYALFLFAALTALGATMTLPGIAAFIISVGMAIDANVLIFERIKEELRAGKTLRAGIQSGWSRAWSAILDSNVTTLVGAAVLFALGTGPIKGFATTLFIGVVISMFTAILVTRVLVDSVARPPIDRFLRFGA
ncbi:MAG TPA: protein translocase subunit SecD [bacterium]|jgi:preprotein translocase subunit SecD|nr:protein translocase subunit SecD [bacterium]